MFFSFSYSVSNEGMQYTLSLDKTEIKGNDNIIRLKADINIDKSFCYEIDTQDYLNFVNKYLKENENKSKN